MLRHYGKLLETFPDSKLAQRPSVLRVYAVEFAEPSLVERPFEPGTDVDDIVAAARDFAQADCCCELETAWDLWQHETEWNLQPVPVRIYCLGPAFEGNETGDHLRIDFGLDSNFLPMPEVDGSLRMQQSNLRSLLHLVGDIEGALSLERRQLWSESGANFADLLKQAVRQFTPDIRA
jgi:hypothetical protein